MASQEKSPNPHTRKIKIEYISSDYDGTISRIGTARNESRIPLETRVMLRQVSEFIPISIITMKDLAFIIPRTPFAHAWSGIGGLEMRIGKRVLKRECLEDRLPSVSQALDYARSHITEPGVEVEEKQDSEGRTVAFCVDWRKAKDMKTAKKEAEQAAQRSMELGLQLLRHGVQPFYDVYPVSPDKGQALQEMLSLSAVKKGVLYMGDSKMDNPAFKASSVSIGVVNDETAVETLQCDYLVEFGRVPEFLNALVANHFVFSSDFPMIKHNPNGEN